MSLELWQDPRVPLQFQVETDLLLRGDGDVGIPFQMKQGNQCSSLLEEGKIGLFLTFGGNFSIPLEWERVSRETSGAS